MSDVFAVFRQGVYRHECGGIFSTRADAIECAVALAGTDGDSWHSYEVCRFELDRRVDAGVWSEGDFCRSPSINEDAAIYSVTKKKLGAKL